MHHGLAKPELKVSVRMGGLCGMCNRMVTQGSKQLPTAKERA